MEERSFGVIIEGSLRAGGMFSSEELSADVWGEVAAWLGGGMTYMVISLWEELNGNLAYRIRQAKKYTEFRVIASFVTSRVVE
jgi:hypothetical protein